MKTIERKTMLAALSAALLALLAACGDETTNTTAYGTENAVSALNKAGKCTEERMGETVYAEKEGMLFVCDGSLWVSMKGEDGQKGARGDSGSVGDDGDPGNPGAKGATCTIKTADGATQMVCGSATYIVATDDDAGLFTDSRDKKVYPWVKIGPFVWMAKNLDYGTMVKKPAAANYAQQSFTNMKNVQKWCRHDSLAYCDTLGGYYQWNNAMALADSCIDHFCSDQMDTLANGWIRHQGICPDGWHIPAQEEFDQLLTVARNLPDFGAVSGNEGKALMATGRWYDGAGVDYFGFAGLPASMAFVDGSYGGATYFAFPVAIDVEGTPEKARLFRVWTDGITEYNSTYPKERGYSLRCVRDWDLAKMQL